MTTHEEQKHRLSLPLTAMGKTDYAELESYR